MILAAGLGTRLGGLSEERPKPLLPVADVPLVRWAVALLAGHDVRELVVNLHHLGHLIEAELGDGALAAGGPAPGARVAYSREAPRILGTGGGLRRALPLLGDDAPIVVVNGKIVFDLDLAEVLARHRASGAAATLVVRAESATGPGATRLDAGKLRVDAPAGGGRVRAIHAAGALSFTGVHVIEPGLLARLPDDGEERCIVRQGYVPWLADGVRVEAVVAPGYFMEHSTPARFLAGNLNLLRGAATVRHAPGPLAGVAPSAEISPAARVESPVLVGPGARIGAGAVVGPDVVLGAGAEVAPGVRLERVVVFAGARVAASCRDAVVGLRGTYDAAEP